MRISGELSTSGAMKVAADVGKVDSPVVQRLPNDHVRLTWRQQPGLSPLCVYDGAENQRHNDGRHDGHG